MSSHAIAGPPANLSFTDKIFTADLRLRDNELQDAQIRRTAANDSDDGSDHANDIPCHHDGGDDAGNVRTTIANDAVGAGVSVAATPADHVA